MESGLNLGQMFVAGFLGREVGADHWLARSLAEDRLGGVILFSRNVDGSVQNIESPRQLAQLVAGLRQFAAIPPLVAIDQEGGRICRLAPKNGFLPSRSAAELAAEGVAATARAAEAMAAELAEYGINLNFAPVVDLNLNPDNPIIGRYQRSFGADPAQVAAHARAFIEAHHRQGIGCCLKHFPGHGSAGSDSHLGFVDTTTPWQTIELEPYRQLLAAGYADGIMTAHLINRRLDPSGLPATLSPAMVTGQLRQELGFGGVVFSDDMQMRAISAGWPYAEAVQRAVLAGVDVVVVGNNLSPTEHAVREGIEAIEALLDSGRIEPQRIQCSLARIARFKAMIAGQQPWNFPGPPTTWS
ncbi:glycoside hydrolase family 3 N-terminal domain-containing protein [Desulfobulbus sp.]|uniref:glycoside hydrolase family 3 N-terminal domain-containing protein n=1 Tax=Desulfobulbus sp. TaxID=895 RepID=UPI00286EE672|nr:glycoside hydrolase family 3 N-terminal domain-containing protein [Desulfobulbus sp.]